MQGEVQTLWLAHRKEVSDGVGAAQTPFTQGSTTARLLSDIWLLTVSTRGSTHDRVMSRIAGVAAVVVAVDASPESAPVVVAAVVVMVTTMLCEFAGRNAVDVATVVVAHD